MHPSFLEFYNRELQYIREMGGEFSQEFPKIAGRLGLDGFECADPYVERLIESFAFMAARVHLKLDHEFPRFTDHLLELVYPQYLAPVPSMAIAQFLPELTEGTLSEGYSIPRNTSLKSILGPNDQTPCEYRTAHDLTLWPIKCTEAEYLSRDSVATRLPNKFQNAKAVIRIRLEVTAGFNFNQLRLDRLPLFLRGRSSSTNRLYEQIFTDALGVVIHSPKSLNDKSSNLNNPSPSSPVVAPGGADYLLNDPIATLGFNNECALLPNPHNMFSGYRLLTEYFNFPQRFLFFEIQGLQKVIKQIKGNVIDLLIPLSRLDSQLENLIDENNFGLFCTPIINLFPHRADRIHLTRGDHEYHIVPDRTRPMDFEVHSLAKVEGYGQSNEKPTAFKPFYDVRDSDLNSVSGASNALFTIRRAMRNLSSKQKRRGPRSSYVGSEAYLSIVDADHAPFDPKLEQLDVTLLCTNRDLPILMPIGKGSTDFTIESGAPVNSIRCVAGPTEPKPSFSTLSGERSWRLISHLSLNYLSLTGTEGAGALRELLGLYQDSLSIGTRDQTDGIVDLVCRPIMKRISDLGPISFGRGLEVKVVCDESRMVGSSAFLLSAVLSDFFSKYVSINSFTQTVLHTLERGEVARWPANIGRRQVL